MPYTETHSIEIGPINLPEGVTVDVKTAIGTGGLQAVTITASTTTAKADTVALLEEAFALLITSASADGVGAPVFVSPSQVPGAPLPVTP